MKLLCAPRGGYLEPKEMQDTDLVDVFFSKTSWDEVGSGQDLATIRMALLRLTKATCIC
jgi:hypothetical protein